MTEMKHQIVIKDGLISPGLWCPSPNYNSRPKAEISLLVIHNISLPPAQFGGNFIEQFFQNKLNKTDHPYFAEIFELKVSSHVLIKRDGQLIQFVNLNDRAWHAGQSCYQQRENCNDFSIGIELEGTDDLAYTDEQYQVLSALTKVLLQAYPDINKTRITGHDQIAPRRKTDPGNAFDWQRYFQSLRENV